MRGGSHQMKRRSREAVRGRKEGWGSWLPRVKNEKCEWREDDGVVVGRDMECDFFVFVLVLWWFELWLKRESWDVLPRMESVVATNEHAGGEFAHEQLGL